MKNEINNLHMTRRIYDIPDDIVKILHRQGLWEEYRERPAYQQNDYIGWITRAKRPEIRAKRLNQMLRELSGNNYDILIAGSCFAIIPILLLFVCFQKYFIEGMTAGSVKG